MKKIISVGFILSFLLTGCATTAMETDEKAAIAQQFNSPEKGYSGLYIYRSKQGYFGGAIKKDIYVDGILIGESAPGVFFYKQVISGEHKISTESEFSNNDLSLNTESGKNYFIRQYIRPGAFVAQASLAQVSEEKGKEAIKQLKMAVTR